MTIRLAPLRGGPGSDLGCTVRPCVGSAAGDEPLPTRQVTKVIGEVLAEVDH